MLFPGDPNSQWGKDFQIEDVVISSEFNVFGKKHQGILEFYGDDIALLKLANKVKMSTHARCWHLGWEGVLREPWKRRHQGPARVTLTRSPQAHLPSLHGGGQSGSAETPRQHLPGAW